MTGQLSEWVNELQSKKPDNILVPEWGPQLFYDTLSWTHSLIIDTSQMDL